MTSKIFGKKCCDDIKLEDKQNKYEDANGKVGETVIAKKPNESKESNKDVGDYVDYEEVKE